MNERPCPAAAAACLAANTLPLPASCLRCLGDCIGRACRPHPRPQHGTERLREWLAARVVKPLVHAIDTAHTNVVDTAARIGWAGVQLQPLGGPGGERAPCSQLPGLGVVWVRCRLRHGSVDALVEVDSPALLAPPIPACPSPLQSQAGQQRNHADDELVVAQMREQLLARMRSLGSLAPPAEATACLEVSSSAVMPAPLLLCCVVCPSASCRGSSSCHAAARPGTHAAPSYTALLPTVARPSTRTSGCRRCCAGSTLQACCPRRHKATWLPASGSWARARAWLPTSGRAAASGVASPGARSCPPTLLSPFIWWPLTWRPRSGCSHRCLPGVSGASGVCGVSLSPGHRSPC